ncbi:hypothetical protein ACFX2C_046190 [Malus domestica]
MSSSEPPKPPADGKKRKSIFSSAEGESKLQKLSSEPPKSPADGMKRKSKFSSAHGESKLQKLSISSGDGGSSVHQAAKAKGIEEEKEAVDEKTTEQADDEETQEDRADEEPEEDEPDEVLVLNDPDRWPERRPVARRPTGSPDSDEMLGDDGYDD